MGPGEKAWASLLAFLPNLLEAAAILAVGWLLSGMAQRFCRKALEKSQRDAGVISFLSSAVSALGKILSVVMALSALGINTNVIVGAFSAVGLGVSLALKENMANVACGIQMLFTKPFCTGDYIAAEGVEGTVERVELMFTVLRTYDNKEVVFPNSKLSESIVTNYTAMEKRRLDLEFSLDYGDSLPQAKELLKRLAAENPQVLKDPLPLVVVKEQKESAVLLSLQLWCRTEDYWKVNFALQEAVKLAFDEAGFHTPFPQLEVRRRKTGEAG